MELSNFWFLDKTRKQNEGSSPAKTLKDKRETKVDDKKSKSLQKQISSHSSQKNLAKSTITNKSE